MTLLADLVAASNDVAATSSRSRKVAVLAELLRGLEVEEVPIAAGLVSGVPRQGRVGVGYSTIYGLEQAPASKPVRSALRLAPDPLPVACWISSIAASRSAIVSKASATGACSSP